MSHYGHGELDRLIRRVERLRRQIGGASQEENQGPVSLLRSECLEATESVRECVKRRDQLNKQGLARSFEGIEAAAAVRRELSNLAIVADRLQAAHTEQDRRKKSPEDAEEVAHILRLVKACMENENPRNGEQLARSSLKPYTTPLLGGSPIVDGVLGRRALSDPEAQQGLLTISAGDRKMDQSLDAIIDGLGRLKGVALDMNEEVKLQSVMIDEIIAKVPPSCGAHPRRPRSVGACAAGRQPARSGSRTARAAAPA